MTTKTNSTNKRSGGCGCGGGGKCGGRCGSKTFPGQPIAGTICEPCEEGAFVRPRFFAGQLLTEDDLEAINTYLVGKNRLHNSRLWGDGVVCGFEVVCGPCGEDQVIVRPGYALDCCGNDLVLDCDRVLDIGDMISSLREQLHPGHGCGNPCAAEAEPKPCIDETAAEPAKKAKEKAAPPPGTPPEPPKRAPDEYCLYVRYQETPAEPTAPYPVGDDCGLGACEHTRVVEGVTFELRCRPPDTAKDDLFARVVKAVAELSPDGKIMDDLKFLHYYAKAAGRALHRLERYEQTGKVELEDAYQERMAYLAKRLGDPSVPGEARTELLAAYVAEGGGQIRPQLKTKKHAPAAEPERTFFEEAEKRFAKAPERELAYAQLGGEALGLYRALREKTPNLDEIDDPALKLYALGWGQTPKITQRVWEAFHNVRTSFARVVQSSTDETDCLTKAELASLPPHQASPGDRVLIPEVSLLVQRSHRLLGLAYAIVRNRACIDAMPPCPSCEDPAVLLACVKVVGCKVVEICNLERKFVLSPRAVRHWVPPIGWFGEALEEMCCRGKLGDLDEGFEPGAARKLLAARSIVMRPDVETLAQAAYGFYTRAPHPVALRKAFETIIPEKYATALGDETMVSRSELYRALDALRAELKGG